MSKSTGNQPAPGDNTGMTPEETLAKAQAEAQAILKAARKDADSITSEAKAAAAAEIEAARKDAAAKNQSVEAPDTAAGRKVTIRLFKDNDKYKSDVPVILNGKVYQIQRGVDVEVPEEVAAILEASMKQDANTAMLIEREVAAGKAAERVLG